MRGCFVLALFMMAVCSEAFADPYRIALPYPDKQYSKQFEVVGYIPDKPYSIGISYSGGPKIFGPDTTLERGNYSSSSLVIDVAGNAMSYSRLIRYACSEPASHCGRHNSDQSGEFPSGLQLISVTVTMAVSGPYAFVEPLLITLNLPNGASLRETQKY